MYLQESAGAVLAKTTVATAAAAKPDQAEQWRAADQRRTEEMLAEQKLAAAREERDLLHASANAMLQSLCADVITVSRAIDDHAVTSLRTGQQLIHEVS